jgi:predicted ATPase
MLIRFEVFNHRSIKDPVELSLVAVDDGRAEARAAPLVGVSLLTVAAIYGPNASGKSNLLDALSWLRDAVASSIMVAEYEIPLDPFALDGRAVKSTGFELEMLIAGVRFEYVLELEPESVIYEGLFHYPEKKRRRIFERDSEGLKLQRGLGALSGTRELLTDRTLALTAARRFDAPLVRRFAEAVQRIQPLGQTIRRSRRQYAGHVSFSSRYEGRSTRQLLEERSAPTLFDLGNDDVAMELRPEQALAMLRMADLGISDVIFEEDENRFRKGVMRAEPRMFLLHDTDTPGYPVPLDFADESVGTKTWFNLVGPVLHALADGSVILFDELDASLHPTLSAELIRLFHSPVENPFGAQLIFTSHDTSLLNHLNRDEVWLTEKRSDGSTRLGSLAEFAGERVRKSQNLESAYLQGRFGALPQVDQYEFLRAFGLVG